MMVPGIELRMCDILHDEWDSPVRVYTIDESGELSVVVGHVQCAYNQMISYDNSSNHHHTTLRLCRCCFVSTGISPRGHVCQ